MHPQYPKVWLDAHGLVNLEFATHAHISREMLQLAHERCAALGAPCHRVLVHALQIMEYDHEALRYLWEKPEEFAVQACAIVLKSYLSLHLGKRLMFYHRPPFPTQLFESESEAIAWLLSLAENQEADDEKDA